MTRFPSVPSQPRGTGAEDVAITVDDEPRQAVGFAVDQPDGIADDGHARPHRDRVTDTTGEEIGVDRSASSKLQARTRIMEVGLKEAQARN